MTDQTSGYPESGDAAPPPGTTPPPPGQYQPPPGQYQPPPGQYQPPLGPYQAPPPGQYQPPPPGYEPQAPPGYKLKKKKPFYKRFWLFWGPVATVVVIIIIIVSVANSVNNAVNNSHTVIYSVTSDGATADITYLNINGDGTTGQEQRNSQQLPWTRTVSGKGDFSSFTVTAQASQNATRISCQIKIDGVTKANQTSTGQFAVVTCNASPS